MSALPQLLSQVPGLVWLFIVIVSFGAVWKIFEVLYVKPRDFEIQRLSREVESLKNSSIKPKLSARRDVTVGSSVEKGKNKSTPATESAQASKRQKEDSNDKLAEGLRNLEFALERMNDSSLTKLQRESVCEYFMGKNVVWNATVGSVSDGSKGYISVVLKSDDDSVWAAFAKFDTGMKAELLSLKKGDRVVVTGRVWTTRAGNPFLEDCSIALVD